MHSYPFKQVDVFTPRPGGGNPVTVVLAADGLDVAEMQRVARGTNLSETTNGRVYVRMLDEHGRAEIGGRAVTVIEGEIRLLVDNPRRRRALDLDGQDRGVVY